MSLRLRVGLAAAVAVLVTIIASSVALYFVVRQHLYDQVDAELSKIRVLPAGSHLQLLERALESGVPAAPKGETGYLQFVDAQGRVIAHLPPR